MRNITAKHTHFNLPVELRFIRVPARWTAKAEDGGRWLIPEVNQHLDRKGVAITSPEEVRKLFFKMKDDENSALDFLNRVGVWSLDESEDIDIWSDGTLRKGAGSVVVGEKTSYLSGAFGYRFIQTGRACPVQTAWLCKERDSWRNQMYSEHALAIGKRTLRARLRKQFEMPDLPTAEDKYIFAASTRGQNTLQVHIEWQKNHASAVIQPITGQELMKALRWIDLIIGSEVKICQNENCGIEYTQGGRKYCCRGCEHNTTTRRYRANLGERNIARKGK